MIETGFLKTHLHNWKHSSAVFGDNHFIGQWWEFFPKFFIFQSNLKSYFIHCKQFYCNIFLHLFFVAIFFCTFEKNQNLLLPWCYLFRGCDDLQFWYLMYRSFSLWFLFFGVFCQCLWLVLLSLGQSVFSDIFSVSFLKVPSFSFSHFIVKSINQMMSWTRWFLRYIFQYCCPGGALVRFRSLLFVL